MLKVPCRQSCSLRDHEVWRARLARGLGSRGLSDSFLLSRDPSNTGGL